MMTVVDQVRPWLTPSRTLANTTQPQVGAHMSSSGTGCTDDPAGDEDGFAAVAVRQGAGEEVGGGLHDAERHDEGERGGERGEPELLLGEQRQDGAFLADHAADERVDADEQRELGEVLPQPERIARPCRGVAHRPDLQRLAGGGGPGVGATSRTPRGRGGRALARMLAAVMARSPCPHITVDRRRRERWRARLEPSSMLSAPGTWPVAYSLAWRTSIDGSHELVGVDERKRRWSAGRRRTRRRCLRRVRRRSCSWPTSRH